MVDDLDGLFSLHPHNSVWRTRRTDKSYGIVRKLIPVGTQYKDSVKHLSCGIHEILFNVKSSLIRQAVNQKLVQVIYLIECHLQTELKG